MRARVIASLCAVLLIATAATTVAARLHTTPTARRLSRQVLADKIRGGWAGQMIGVSFGAPVEFASNGRIFDGVLAWSPERVTNALHQDDLYVEMTFAEVMDRLGLDATSEQYGEAFQHSTYDVWHANAGARRLLNAGIKAPWSGHPRYNIHANDIDFQIESDFIGLMTPGLPREANTYADRVGHVMAYGDGVYGGMFFAGMYAAAFFEHDPRRVVEAGLRSIPSQSGYARIIRDVLAWSQEHPDDWRKTWRLLEDTWDKDDPCPDGALSAFTIDARLNGAYVAMALLYGRGDFATTIEVATRAGQDADCNPSSAAGILGVMIGYAAIPERWKSGIAAIADTRFDYTNYSFNSIAASTVRRALRVIQRAGGTVTEVDVSIPRQEPVAWPLEQWNPGTPARLIGIDDTAWTWSGAWTTESSEPDGGNAVRVASGAGTEVSLRFTGVAMVLVGPLSQAGGRADVFVDGRKTGQLDAFIPERTHDNALWHAYDLAPGEHTVHIVLRDDADARARGNRVVIERAISYASPGAATGRP